MRSAAIQPQNGRQSLEEALREAGLRFEEDILGVEEPDGKKKPPPKEAKKKPLKVPHFDNSMRDTNSPFAHDGAAVVGPSGPASCARMRTDVI